MDTKNLICAKKLLSKTAQVFHQKKSSSKMSLTLIEAVRKRLFASPLVLFPPLGGVQFFAITHYTLPLPCSADS